MKQRKNEKHICTIDVAEKIYFAYTKSKHPRFFRADYLKRKGSEVVNMLTAEYDYETDIEVQRGEAYDEGREEEKKNLIKIYMKQNLQLLRFQNC